MEKDKQDRYSIHSIEKALDVFEALSAQDSLSLIELAELVNQPKSSLYRIILTLEKRGFISRSQEDGKYCLGYKQLIITKNLLERSSLRNAALTEMNKLVEKYGDTVNLCVLMEQEILYVEIIEGTYALRMSDKIGSKSPFHATATGKAIAAFLQEDQVRDMIAAQGLPRLTPNTITEESSFYKELEQVREQGFAVDNEEITQGARCIGVPIFDMFGHVAGAISISGAVHRFPNEQLPEIAASVKEAGRMISQKLGYLSVM
ncbi:IclR family transcriptional regulator [Paenibacillus baekrokdamisoli]|uniref:IclR family transcriptional regulator n=1 Tax=Paenibacillus baekrokdamisoli TaxID=1712516 RepID=A0A3G9JKC2_9BACL|nr:IclR family transcriptional regulator [Paenibacillus baekrokdamisoli]MBB3068667.1 IclR family acetate operon transcriptional repressor [Paenibacillus baekrokdamisoli]BBH23499.1 IclR family transcriptional regulator [Paenibacillus baekrokdamisoli]